jgi:protein-disulfide isomerase
MRRSTLLLTGVVALVACGDARREGHDEGPRSPTRSEEADVVAWVGSARLSRRELEASRRLELYDLEVARHAIRRAAARRWIAEQLQASDGEAIDAALADGRARLALPEPARPRVDRVADPKAPARGGPPDAPVSIVVFCDFQSAHCARYQARLRDVIARLGGRVRLVHRVVPLPFHRRATRAALAARCADRQGRFWAYHDGLYAIAERRGAERADALASTLSLDRAAFDACLSDASTSAALRVDLEQAEALGLVAVPVSFVNGLYVKGPVERDVLAGVVEGELHRLGLDPGALTAEDEQPIPVRLVGTVASTDPSLARATFESEGWRATRVLGLGDEVLQGYVLRAIAERSVRLERPDGKGLTLWVAPSLGVRQEVAPPRKLPEPEGTIHLTRRFVDAALADRPALERDLERGRLDLQGERLLKLARVEEGGLYARLGLEPGDVLLQVDDVFVGDAHNPLWDALAERRRVKLTIVRRGLPHSFEVSIDPDSPPPAP